MIISLNRKFAFIHIPKTAGVSIETALKQFDQQARASSANKLARLLRIPMDLDKACWGRHDGLKLVESLTNDARLQGLTTFAVVRNPYTHAVSHYNYMKSLPVKRYGARVRKMSFETYLRMRQRPAGTFVQLYERNLWFMRLPDQASFVCDRKEKVIASRILRFENLSEEWAQLCRDLGLDACELPHTNKGSIRPNYSSSIEMTDECRHLIEDIYARDFDLFDYKKKT